MKAMKPGWRLISERLDAWIRERRVEKVGRAITKMNLLDITTVSIYVENHKSFLIDSEWDKGH
jgi:hypothetical protein